MGQQFAELSDKHIQFIAEQRIFFVGTATADSCVSVLPKAWDTKKVEEGLRHYWEEKNQMSIDGSPTNIVARNG